MSTSRLLIILFLLFQSTILACEFESVTFHRDFSAASLDSCDQISKFEYDLWFKPENVPINPSAWYAFKVSAKTEQTITINLKYKQAGYHRYPPKMSHDGRKWQLLAHQETIAKVVNRDRAVAAHFQLAVSSEPVWISAQEILDQQYYSDWITQLEQQHKLRKYQISQSVEKRPIWALEHTTDSSDWLVLIGRQHPPEVTGAMAMEPFVETILSELKTSEAFRKQYNILIVPLVNPDGVENGFWRHNVGGKDLNRDWSDFSQPETRGIHERLQQIVKEGGKIEFAVDFHSTWKSLFYTMPTDYDLENPMFARTWMENLQETLPNFEVDERPGVSRNPGVFKQYIADTYGVHSVTYEVGDEADRNETITVAKTSAILLMKQMLQE